MTKRTKKCTFKEMEKEVQGYRYYIYNQKKEIISILGLEKPILKVEQIIRIKKDEFGNLPESLKEKEIVTILKFRIPSEESENSIIQILDSMNKEVWISPVNVKTH